MKETLTYNGLPFRPKMAFNLKNFAAIHASIELQLRKLHYHTLHKNMTPFIILRWSESEKRFGDEHAPSR